MPLLVTYLGHSGFLLDDGAARVVIDPFLTGNPKAVHEPAQIACDFVALTHGHADHFGDTVAIVTANDATLVAAYEICEFAAEQGVARTEPANPGGRIATSFGWIALTHAFHSSSYEGRYMGMPCGVVVHMGGTTFYHCGDTDLFSDMRLIGEIYRPDIAAIPVGDRFTMGPSLANRAAEMIGAPTVVPIHYGTFPLLLDDIDAFQPVDVALKKMSPGDTWKHV